MLRIVYHYRRSLLGAPERQTDHARICAALDELRTRGVDCVIEDTETRFPTYETQAALIEDLRLREFSMRRKVALGRLFGSQRARFSWVPAQFLLVYRDDELTEVFPCRIAGSDIEPFEYLDRTVRGQPWTSRSGKGMEGKRHKALVAQIVSNPDLAEPGLTLRGRDVQVARDGEIGFVDLVFEDRNHRTLLVEVKVEADELAKAVGQILWHRQLFAVQNSVSRSDVRVAICCQYIPLHYRTVCEDSGIKWFEVQVEPLASG